MRSVSIGGVPGTLLARRLNLILFIMFNRDPVNGGAGQRHAGSRSFPTNGLPRPWNLRRGAYDLSRFLGHAGIQQALDFVNLIFSVRHCV